VVRYANRSGAVVAMLVLAGLFGCAAEEKQAPAQDVMVTANVVYGHKFGMALTFDVFRPRESNGAAVIFMNSGGFESGVLRQCKQVGDQWEFVKKDTLMIPQAPMHLPLLEQFSFEDLLAAGFTVFDVRHGSSPKFTLDEIVEDCRSAVRFIKENAADFPVDPDRIGLWGASAGGYLAIFVGATADETDGASTRVKAIAVYYPAGFDWLATVESFPMVQENLPSIQIDSEILETLSIKDYLSPDDPPLLVIHGDQDFPFITAASESLVAGFQGQGCEAKVVVFPETGHEFSGAEGYNEEYGEKAMAELVEWFQGHLGAQLPQ